MEQSLWGHPAFHSPSLSDFGVKSPPRLSYSDLCLHGTPEHSELVSLANKGTSFLLPAPKITLEGTEARFL